MIHQDTCQTQIVKLCNTQPLKNGNIGVLFLSAMRSRGLSQPDMLISELILDQISLIWDIMSVGSISPNHRSASTNLIFKSYICLGIIINQKSSPLRGPFLAPAEGCSLRLLQVGSLGPSRGPVGFDEFSEIVLLLIQICNNQGALFPPHVSLCFSSFLICEGGGVVP